ncbi:hypothetical protein Tco_1153929 [Tanacetum coccineum]
MSLLSLAWLTPIHTPTSRTFNWGWIGSACRVEPSDLNGGGRRHHTRVDTPASYTPPSGTPPLLPIPLPTSSPPLHLLSINRRADRPEVTLPPQKRLGITLGPRYEVGESSYAPIARPPRGAPATDDTEIGQRMVEFTTRVRQDTDEIYTRLDDEQSERQLMAGCLERLGDNPWMRLLKRLQTQMTEFERQKGPAKGPAQPDAPEEAGSSS